MSRLNFCLPMIFRTSLIVSFAFLIVCLSFNAIAIAQASKQANSQQIDLVRVGDEVEVMKLRSWYPGTVLSYKDGKIEVEFQYRNRKSTRKFSLSEIRFPNGEGPWQQWKDASGKFSITARYASQTETDVTLITEKGKRIKVPIAKLSLTSKKFLEMFPASGSEKLVSGSKQPASGSRKPASDLKNSGDGVSPFRVGDQVTYRSGTRWNNATITELADGKATISYTKNDKESSKTVDLKYIAFPDGQGPWMTWQDESNKFNVVARYINRTDSKVTLMTEDKKEISLDIDRLAPNLRAVVQRLVSWTSLPKKVASAKDAKKVSLTSGAPNFSTLALDSSSIKQSTVNETLTDGGLSFPLTFGNQISVMKPTGVDGWIAVGTYSDGDLSKYPITRLYWINPATGKMAIGPGFSGDQQIVDYSAKQGRLLTAIMSTGFRATAIGFCTYRVAPGSLTATPEHRWEPPENDSRLINQDPSFKATLINDNQLLIAIDSNLALYDLEKSSAVFQLDGLDGNNFQVHPSGKYVLVRGVGKKLSLLETSSGQQVGTDDSGKFRASGFSQDGSRIVGVTSDLVYLWDITQDASAKQFASKNLASSKTFGTAKFFDNQWVWVDGHLFNTAKEILAWNYTDKSSGSNRALFDVKTMSLVGDHVVVGSTLGSRMDKTGPMAFFLVAKIPHKAAVEQLNSVDSESISMLKPGVGVRIEIEGDPRIRKGLERAIAANGWTEDPNSKIIVAASAKVKPPEVQVYEEVTRSFRGGRAQSSGDPSKIFSITVAPWLQTASISYEGNRFWYRGVINFSPSKANTKEELLKLVKKAGDPSYSLFEDLELPVNKIYPQYQSGLGYTKFTQDGFKDVVTPLPDAAKK